MRTCFDFISRKTCFKIYTNLCDYPKWGTVVTQNFGGKYKNKAEENKEKVLVKATCPTYNRMKKKHW